MTFLIGTDEAGYGPNLGPLTIAVSVWRVPNEPPDADLYELLNSAVTRDSVRGDPRVTFADSKQLFSPGSGLGKLELGVLSCLALRGTYPQTWRALWPLLDPTCAASMANAPWFQNFEANLPRDTNAAEIERATLLLQDAFHKTGVTLRDLRSAVVFPDTFNALIERHGNKAAALSHTTIALLQQAVATLEPEPIVIHCDKHGGRNQYAALLQHFFPDELIEVARESRDCSLYRWGPRERRVEIRFVTKGERWLPAALASMACKYLRELAMLAFNDFWCSRLSDLKATAGYPVDALRFKAEIETLQRKLNIDDRQLWRCR